MKTMTAEEASQNFSDLHAAGRSGPVEIMRDGVRLGVFLPQADAELIGDMLLAQKAAIAKAEGYVGLEASEALMRKFLDAKD